MVFSISKIALPSDLILAKLVDQAQQDSTVRVIFVHGGKNFTAGNNITEFKEWRDPEMLYKFSSLGNLYNILTCVRAFKDSIKPIVGLVRGWSIGIGFTVSSLFTFLYCTPDAKFLAPFSSSF